MLAVVMGIDREACEENNRYCLVRRETLCSSCGRLPRENGTGRECVVRGDVGVHQGRYEHARATASVTLQSVLGQPLIERLNPAPEVIGVVPRLKSFLTPLAARFCGQKLFQ